jgi:hypothetical protein
MCNKDAFSRSRIKAKACETSDSVRNEKKSTSCSSTHKKNFLQHSELSCRQNKNQLFFSSFFALSFRTHSHTIFPLLLRLFSRHRLASPLRHIIFLHFRLHSRKKEQQVRNIKTEIMCFGFLSSSDQKNCGEEARSNNNK